MRNAVYFLTIILFSSCGISQSVYDDLQKRYNTLQLERDDFKEKYEILSAKCSVGETVATLKRGNVIVDVISAKGSKTNQSITFEFTITNMGPNTRASTNIPSGFFKGNTLQYEGSAFNATSSTWAGCAKKSGCASELLTNVPLNATLTFYEILPKGDTASSLKIHIKENGNDLTGGPFYFKNLTINWEG